MERLWTPWRYDYITRAKKPGHPGVPEALSAWPGPKGSGQTGSEPASCAGSDTQADSAGCVFCNMIAAVDCAIAQGMPTEDAERAAHVIARGPTCFLCLNAFPYSTGHVLLVPYRHTGSLAALTLDESQELMAMAQEVERVITRVYRPSGMNFGLNLGEAGGAGIAAHLHMHALPRWIGDANFMTVTADTRVLPEALNTTWRKIRAAWPQR